MVQENEYVVFSLLQLLPISDEKSILDLVIFGCGPAGLSLASESAKKGLTVGLIGPDLPFTNNYGVWEDEFKGIVALL
jgi:lycopene epsilon-cyclase